MARFERRGFRRFGPRINVPRPVNVGEEYDVEINEVGSRGDGIARVKNFVVFVPNTKKGEKTRIKIKEVRNRFAIGEKIGAAEEAVTEEVVEKEEVVEEEKPAEEEKPTEEVITEEAKEPAEEVETKETEEPTEEIKEEK